MYFISRLGLIFVVGFYSDAIYNYSSKYIGFYPGDTVCMEDGLSPSLLSNQCKKSRTGESQEVYRD